MNEEERNFSFPYRRDMEELLERGMPHGVRMQVRVDYTLKQIVEILKALDANFPQAAERFRQTLQDKIDKK